MKELNNILTALSLGDLLFLEKKGCSIPESIMKSRAKEILEEKIRNGLYPDAKKLVETHNIKSNELTQIALTVFDEEMLLGHNRTAAKISKEFNLGYDLTSAKATVIFNESLHNEDYEKAEEIAKDFILHNLAKSLRILMELKN